MSHSKTQLGPLCKGSSSKFCGTSGLPLQPRSAAQTVPHPWPRQGQKSKKAAVSPGGENEESSSSWPAQTVLWQLSVPIQDQAPKGSGFF